MKRKKAITAFSVILVISLLTTFIIRHSGRRPDSHPSSETAQRPAASERSHPPVATPSPTEAEKGSGHAETPKPGHDAAELSETIAREAAEAGHQREAYDQPGEAAEFYRLKRAPEGEKYVPVERYLAAREQMRRMPRYSTAQNRLLPAENESAAESATEENLLGAWTPLGPGNVGGRTRALLIDPTNPDVIYAAGVTGGVWKTTNGGASWTPLADLIANIAVSALAMDPKNPNVIYAGTGEGVTGDFRGAGIFKSTNGGATWTQLSSTGSSDFYFVNDLVISPTSSQRIYAATTTGVWRSLDGGATWNQALNPQVTGGCLDLAMRTDQATDYIFAACGTFQQATIYRNTDAAGAGAWTAVHTEAGMGRTSLALAPSNQNVIYAASAEYFSGTYRHGLHAIFRSTSSGDAGTWTAQVRNTDAVRLNTLLFTNTLFASLSACGLAADIFSSQGWYDNAIAVDPLNENRVWAGGIDLFRSDDGGRNWGLASHWWAEKNLPQYAHADQHVIAFHPGYNGAGNQTMFVAGDGGIFRTGNARAAVATGPFAACNPANSAVTWTSLNNGYGVTQFYHGAVSPDGRSWIGGTQDNGTLRGTEADGVNGWREIYGGDGGYVAIDPTSPNVIYAEATGLSIRKSTDGGATFSRARFGISEPGSNFLFITPFVMDPSDPQRLWIGGSSLWRTQNGAATWQQASGPVGQISAIAVAPTNANYLLAGNSGGTIFRTSTALTDDSSAGLLPATPRGGYVSWLAFDPASHNIAYAAYSTFGGQHVWRSTDAGATWTAIDGSGANALPDIPVHCLVVDPDNTARLYVGTDLGVFVTTDGGANWAVENTGFANVVVESMTLNSAGGTRMLYAFTHGRGVWRIRLSDSVCSYSLSSATQSFGTSGGSGSVNVTGSPGGCQWNARSNADWISITTGDSGAGSGTVSFSVAANNGVGARAGVITVAGRSFTITQEGAPDLTAPVVRFTSPTSASTLPWTSPYIIISGTATDNAAVKEVTWTNDRGRNGLMYGRENWTTDLIALERGVNHITVTATDQAGNTGSATLTVIFNGGYTIYSFAGNGTSGYGGDGGAATAAALNGASDLVFDKSGNLYVSELYNYRIRRITPDGIITTFAGSGQPAGSDGGPVGLTGNISPRGLAIDDKGNIYFAEYLHHRIRKIDVASGQISTVAGIETTIYNPTDVEVDKAGNLYIASSEHHQVIKVAPGGAWSVFAGTGAPGFSGDGGPATAAKMTQPISLLADQSGNVYIGEGNGQRVRKVSPDGIITTLTSPGAVYGLAMDSGGRIFCSSFSNHRVVLIHPGGNSEEIAGSDFTSCSGDGCPATAVSLRYPSGLALDSGGRVYVANGSRIWRLVPPVSTDNVAPTASITSPTTAPVYTTTGSRLNLSGTASDNIGVTHVSWSNDRGGSGVASGTTNWSVSNLPLSSGLNNITVTAWDAGGNSQSVRLGVTFNPAAVLATVVSSLNFASTADALRLRQPETVALDAAGSLYIADTGNHRIRRVSRDGVITTIAGNGQLGSSGDGGPATAASLNEPGGIALDAAGNLYIADTNNHRIRKVTPAGTISTVAGTGISDFGGDGGPATQARLDTPVGLATDAQGNLYIADAGNHRIRKLTLSSGVITTIAGSGYGFGGDGGAAVAAQFNFPTGVAIDGAGNLYISDTGNHRVRRVNAAGIVSTVAGTGSAGSGGDGGPATAAQLNAPGGIGLDSAGNLFIADQGNHRVRKLAKDGRISTVAGNGTSGAGGDGGAAVEAQLNSPAGVAIDRAGNLFIADTYNHRVVVVADYKAATTVSAASYATTELPGEAIAAAFGTNLATTIQSAPGLPLPTVLAGTTVRVRDSRGTERLAPLFFVSPQQVNYQLPAGTAAGPATVTITNADGSISTGAVNVVAASPGLFSADASGSGLAAALVFRIRADGTQSYEPVARFDAAQNKFVALPVDFGADTDQVFLVLFGTGIRGRSALSAVTAKIGGADCEVIYAGPQGGFVGLDQVNLKLPRTLAGRGAATVQLTIDGRTANTVQVTIK
ncbi:MAG TPA: BACON domain-containing carbohydrate-binding protein [Blastocatellia bacterium]|nr:BACON domain-containing carbohydrate-binding protein [Blastocatellia bacterium]